MVRVTGGPSHRNRHRKIIKANKGFRGKRKNSFKLAMQAWMKARLNAYIGRKQKKRDYRSLWIKRISNALQSIGLKYSVVKNNWLHAKLGLDRKTLSELAVNYPKVFEKLAKIKK